VAMFGEARSGLPLPKHCKFKFSGARVRVNRRGYSEPVCAPRDALLHVFPPASAEIL